MENEHIVTTKAELFDQNLDHILEIHAKFERHIELNHHILDAKGEPFRDHAGQELIINNDDIPNLIKLLQMMHNPNH